MSKIVVPLHRIRESRCPDGGIGRRAGLKHQWGNPSRFDPGSGYKIGKLNGFPIFFMLKILNSHFFFTFAKCCGAYVNNKVNRNWYSGY